tara:strand:- start:7733 stop:8275 length:543 start_codon:yes stop_codon:yes gene_type:complete
MRALIILSTLSLILFSCDSSPLSVENGFTEVEKIDPDSIECSENNATEDCDVELISITVNEIDQPCVTYDFMLRIASGFEAPVGLQSGSKSRVDWEFLPNGNTGFWISSITNASSQRSGVIENFGCFSFGDQTTLIITQTITDHNGHVSNELTYSVENTTRSKVTTQTTSGADYSYSVMN